MDTNVKTGTTTVGILCKDGVLIAADTRSTVGNIIASEDVKKVHRLTDYLVFTAAGGAADIEALDKILRAEFKLYSVREGRRITTDAAVSVLQNLLHQYKMMPFMAVVIIGGVDEDGTPKLYNLDPIGSASQVYDHTAFGGSGWLSAQAVLDDNYQSGTTVVENIPLAVRAITIAKKRDSASGGGVDIYTITKTGATAYYRLEFIQTDIFPP